MTISYHKKFLKRFSKTPSRLKDVISKRLFLFEKDPFAQELNNQPLKGQLAGLRSINITGDLRAIYKEKSPTEVIFVMMGTHAELYE